VSIQYFLWFPLCSPEDLSSSESSTSSSGDNNEMLVGEVTNDEIKTPFGAEDAKAMAVKDRKIAVAAHKGHGCWGNKWVPHFLCPGQDG
jgi:hypothetical protein